VTNVFSIKEEELETFRRRFAGLRRRKDTTADMPPA
jgi:hypothetical protein